MNNCKNNIAFITLGCKVNQVEQASWQQQFIADGKYNVLTDYKRNIGKIDAVVINTCAVTENSAKKSLQLCKRIRSDNPKALIVMVGCWIESIENNTSLVDDADICLGTRNKDQLLALVNAKLYPSSGNNCVLKYDWRFEELGVASGNSSKTRAFIKIQDGCSSRCSYCIIPKLRGPARSRPADSILMEIEQLVTKGYKEIVVTGINIGQYSSRNGNYKFHDLLFDICNMDGDFRLRIGSLEATEISSEFCNVFNKFDRICAHLHIPLQAGCNNILKCMKRNYTKNDIKILFQSLRRIRPDLAITTDIIVGFPGESNKQFLSTKQFLQEIDVADCHIFPYSRREGTAAATMLNQVDNAKIENRVIILNEQVQKQRKAFIDRFIGVKTEVLVEGVKAGIASGLTNNYIKVHMRANKNICRGQLVIVKLIGVEDEKIWAEYIS